MVRSDDAQLQDMFAGFDAVERAFFAFEHAQQLAVDIGVGMMATFAFGKFVMNLHLVALKSLAFGGGENLDAGAFGGFERSRCVFLCRGFCRRNFAFGGSCCAAAENGSAMVKAAALINERWFMRSFLGA